MPYARVNNHISVRPEGPIGELVAVSPCRPSGVTGPSLSPLADPPSFGASAVHMWHDRHLRRVARICIGGMSVSN